MGMGEQILQVLIPTQKVAEVKNGKKRTHSKIFFPGYILVQTATQLRPENPSDEDQKIWYTIRNTPGVMGFVGSGANPIPLAEKEVQNILQVSEGKGDEGEAPVITFAVGDKVQVIDGHFSGFPGEVNEIDQDNQKLVVMISIFGRPNPVELDFVQVEKI
jgi:transcriptional antiterminator NusG